MIIDTHCHLDDSRYDEDLEEVILRAKENGVKAFIIPGADPDTLPKAQNIAHEFEDVYYAAGVHPYDIDKYDESFLRQYLNDPKCIAVGECGLDYYRLPDDEVEKERVVAKQKEVFASQIELAKEFKKPIIVHIREASNDSMSILIEHNVKEVGGVLHCYNADEQLLKLTEHGFYYGIGGVLTFKNARKLPQVLPKVPLSRLVIETDAPYLTPHPHRGKRNEPYYTVFVAEKIAEVLKMEVKDIENITTKNSCELFGIEIL
ncbi:TatD family hydrolase [Hydrogenimonas thermophila]|uniref:TatD family hydrolase n=1 Tax=Hydrogenimonas thermophila TaxID=223786 RepID=UPI002936D839|nr:TatD family hydrolase [Hydrogenimonas thermophila]WOE69284.1 TatD family hydrolase [Hydrogenimonas thermophila]WOE71794.1 TatD family hydrolase [Hydrogenimonas thermophila]